MKVLYEGYCIVLYMVLFMFAINSTQKINVFHLMCFFSLMYSSHAVVRSKITQALAQSVTKVCLFPIHRRIITYEIIVNTGEHYIQMVRLNGLSSFETFSRWLSYRRYMLAHWQGMKILLSFFLSTSPL